MTILPSSEIREVPGISPNQLHEIRQFLQGAVYSWVKNRKGEWFAARDLMGGENFDWTGTPLQCLYDAQTSAGKDHENAVKGAGISLGWILKRVLHEDNRLFECNYDDRVAHYRWHENGT